MALEASWLSPRHGMASGCFLQDSLNRYFRPRTVTANNDGGHHHHERDQDDGKDGEEEGDDHGGESSPLSFASSWLF